MIKIGWRDDEECVNDQGSLLLHDIFDIWVWVNVDLALTFAKKILNGSKILLIESDLLPELTSSNDGLAMTVFENPYGIYHAAYLVKRSKLSRVSWPGSNKLLMNDNLQLHHGMDSLFTGGFFRDSRIHLRYNASTCLCRPDCLIVCHECSGRYLDTSSFRLPHEGIGSLGEEIPGGPNDVLP